MFIKLIDVPRPEWQCPRGGGPGATRRIYALVDPESEDVRYVGQTGKGLDTRLEHHLEKPTNYKTAEWFRELREKGMIPDIVTIHRVKSELADMAEMEWIAWFRARGELLNIDAGGKLAELGSGFDDLKREKLAAIIAWERANGEDGRPPRCARDNRSISQKRNDMRALARRREKRAASVKRKADKRRQWLRDLEVQVLCIDPIIRRTAIHENGPVDAREDPRRHANITPRDALGGTRASE